VGPNRSISHIPECSLLNHADCETVYEVPDEGLLGDLHTRG
jgi:hypothetical protein